MKPFLKLQRKRGEEVKLGKNMKAKEVTLKKVGVYEMSNIPSSLLR
jgi:hypothetical protein